MCTFINLENLMKPETTILNITDSDGDGIGCGLVFQAYAEKQKTGIEIVHTGPTKVDFVMKEVIDHIDEIYKSGVNKIFVSDLCPKAETIRALMDKISGKTMMFRVYDHHGTAVPVMEKFPWHVTVDPNPDQSAAKLCYKKLIGNGSIDETFYGLIERISDYDCWKWQRDRNPALNAEEDWVTILNNIYKNPAFLRERLWNNVKNAFMFDEIDKMLIKNQNDRQERFLENLRVVEVRNEADFTFGLIMATEFSNPAMCKVYTEHDVDFAINIIPEPRLISIRSANEREDCDCIDVVKFFGLPGKGGGHKHAAGTTVSTETMLELISLYYKGIDEQNASR